LVFIEKKIAYCTRVVELTDDDLSRGRMQNRAMIRQLAKMHREQKLARPRQA